MPKNIKITPATGLLDFIGNRVTESTTKSSISLDALGNLTYVKSSGLPSYITNLGLDSSKIKGTTNQISSSHGGNNGEFTLSISNNFIFPGTARISSIPLVDADVVNKLYLDQTLSDLKIRISVKIASTGNVNVSSPGSSINGVSLTSGDRVLLKNQSSQYENGIYVFNGSGSPMTRTVDSNSWDELVSAIVVVERGTADPDTVWICTSDTGGTLGSTSINYSKVGGDSITLGTIGIDPNQFGLLFSSGVLRLQPASGTFGGAVTSFQQTFAGNKTFNNNLTVIGNTVMTGNLTINSLTNNGIAYLNSTKDLNRFSFGSNNTVLVGSSTSTIPVWKTITVNNVGMDSNGNISIPTVSPGGSTTEIQYRDGGAFGGDSRLFWDPIDGYLVNRGYYLFEHALNSGSGFLGRISNTNDLTFQMGFNTQGAYGGTINTLSGSQFFVYNFQGPGWNGTYNENYYWGFNSSGDNFWGNSNSIYSVRIQQKGVGKTPLTIKGSAGQTAHLFKINDNNDVSLVVVSNTGSMGVGGNPHSSAIVDLTSTTKGFLPPRVSTIDRDAIPNPTAGLEIFNITTGEPNFHDGVTWKTVISSSVPNFVSKEIPTGSINGTNDTFVLAYTPVIGTEHVYMNGILLEETSDYTITTNVIVFVSGAIPLSNDKLRVSYFK